VSQPGCGSPGSDGPAVWRDASPGSRVPGRPVPRASVAPGGKAYKVALSTVSWTREVSWRRRTVRRAAGQRRAKSAATRSVSGSGCWGSGLSVPPPVAAASAGGPSAVSGCEEVGPRARSVARRSRPSTVCPAINLPVESPGLSSRIHWSPG